MTLLAALITIVSVSALVTTIGYFIKDIKDGAQVSKRLSAAFNNDDMAEARKYAAMFGLNNEHDINVEEILEMGRKYEEFLGTEKLEEIHAAIIQQQVKRHFYLSPKSNGRYHRLKVMMKAHDLIAVSAPTFVTTNKLHGGDRNGEPTSTTRSYRAA